MVWPYFTLFWFKNNLSNEQCYRWIFFIKIVNLWNSLSEKETENEKRANCFLKITGTRVENHKGVSEYGHQMFSREKSTSKLTIDANSSILLSAWNVSSTVFCTCSFRHTVNLLIFFPISESVTLTRQTQFL